MAIDLRKKRYILDGAMGTMLQKAGMGREESSAHFSLNNPDKVYDIHRQYIEAGADIIYGGTFGINRYKMGDLDMDLEEAVRRTMETADRARRDGEVSCGRPVYLALGFGPLGELLEPMGTLAFEEAYDAFSEIVRAAKGTGADIAVIETMTDLYEVKAAVLAVKENSDLPVMVSMTFEDNMRTFTGTAIESMVLTLEGLGVDAVGINCSLGPVEILPMIKRMRELTDLPVFAKPNAGLPDPATGEYDITCDMFCSTMKEYLEAGVNMIGGCCGTTPEYIEGLRRYRDEMEDVPVVIEKPERTLTVCSSTETVKVDRVRVIGERLNPTGKKRMKQALMDRDYDYILGQAIDQVDAGAAILDVNVGTPGLDEADMLPRIVKKLQSVTETPLQIDSTEPAAVEAALRAYNGKAILNSVNGNEELMDRILPIVKKYGAAVICLTFGEGGIPETAEERFDIACRIYRKAMEYGIPKEDIIVDCLTLTASAQQKEVNETLRAVRMVKERLGVKTTLGVSNISFGLPARSLVNRTFLAMALECGLDLPIINPNDDDMMSAVYVFNVLKNVDSKAEAFIERYGDYRKAEVVKVKKEAKDEGDVKDIFRSIEKGLKKETVDNIGALLAEHSEMEVVNSYIIPALDSVGKGFESGRIFLPQMLQAATAAQAGFDVIKERLAKSDSADVSYGTIVIATVKGDIHDIGKNIVKVILENYGFRIIDLGRDVPAEDIVRTVLEEDIELVGLSALMTTTLKSMEDTIAAIKEAAPGCRVMAGGAVLTEEYAHSIGADYYCRDAMKSVEAARDAFGIKE